MNRLTNVVAYFQNFYKYTVRLLIRLTRLARAGKFANVRLAILSRAIKNDNYLCFRTEVSKNLTEATDDTQFYVCTEGDVYVTH